MAVASRVEDPMAAKMMFAVSSAALGTLAVIGFFGQLYPAAATVRIGEILGAGGAAVAAWAVFRASPPDSRGHAIAARRLRTPPLQERGPLFVIVPVLAYAVVYYAVAHGAPTAYTRAVGTPGSVTLTVEAWPRTSRGGCWRPRLVDQPALGRGVLCLRPEEYDALAGSPRLVIEGKQTPLGTMAHRIRALVDEPSEVARHVGPAAGVERLD